MERLNATRELEKFRVTIDNLDAALIHLLAERFRCTDAVGELKAKSGLPPKDEGREARQFARARDLATASNADPAVVENILKAVIHEVVKKHERIAAENLSR
ncbi:chorismate mutase [Rhizobium sp. NFR07]|uniref:chorismate mutase n=1 Tax=Rhizobium sp. NFR07 TaxID=1566262 RepID=UPI0008E3A78A|nr:chorismate mutase [Rhizobium sp. NFR07]SFB65089.1 chorismate mutase [Rhizobium sp. NFR07]